MALAPAASMMQLQGVSARTTVRATQGCSVPSAISGTTNARTWQANQAPGAWRCSPQLVHLRVQQREHTASRARGARRPKAHSSPAQDSATQCADEVRNKRTANLQGRRC
jgi:hypothetical protein